MDDDTIETQRRAMLQLAGGLTAASAASAVAAAAPPRSQVALPRPTGKAGGRWTIAQRRLKDGEWDRFDGEATVHGLLGGILSVEELRIPARNFSGMGLRLLDVERRLWADFWVNARSGVLEPPPAWGSFVDGVGTWDTEDGDGAERVIWRGCWDRITPRSCRWTQSTSRDGERGWQEQWVMEWTRVG